MTTETTDGWDNTTETTGAWGDPMLVIDTNTYAGNIERELCAACTGQTGECEVGQDVADKYDGPDLEDAISRRPDEHGCWRPVTIYPTPGLSVRGGHPVYQSVRIFLTRELTPEELAGIKARAEAYARAPSSAFTRRFRITGYRLVRERTVTQARAV